jgi:hypothetical protein
MKTAEDILSYFDCEKDDGEITYSIKKGYICRSEGFSEFNIIRVHYFPDDDKPLNVVLSTDASDWYETEEKTSKLLAECNVYKLEKVI